MLSKVHDLPALVHCLSLSSSSMSPGEHMLSGKVLISCMANEMKDLLQRPKTE